jgi:hypothetical protein
MEDTTRRKGADGKIILKCNLETGREIVWTVLNWPRFLHLYTAAENVVLIEFWQNWSKQYVVHYVLRSTNLFNPFGIRKNLHSSEMNLLLRLLIKRETKLAAVIMEEHRSYKPPTEMLSSSLLARLNTHVDEIIGDPQRGPWCNRSDIQHSSATSMAFCVTIWQKHFNWRTPTSVYFTGKVKVYLLLCLTKHHSIKTYWRWRYSATHSWPRH